MIRKCMRILSIVTIVLGVTATLALAVDRFAGTVQDIDTGKTSFTFMTGDGKHMTFEVPVEFLSDLKKGEQVEVLVDDGLVIAVDRNKKDES